jgi:hypothetical protein
MRKLLAIALCALSLGVYAKPVAPAAPASAAPAPAPRQFATFEDVATFPEWTFGVDVRSHAGSFTEGYSVVTIRIKFRELQDVGVGAKVIGLVNTLFIDCAKDELTVLVSQAFGAKGERVAVQRFYAPIKNMHQASVPVSETMDLMCSDHEAYPHTPNTPRPDAKVAP